MKLRTANAKAGRLGLILLAVFGLTLGGVVGCDTAVQTALVSGLSDAANSAASALIDAAFLAITPDQNSSSSSSLSSGT